MCRVLVWSFDVITGLPWLEIIKAMAPVATAIIAFFALKNWKRQDKAKRQADFLDQFTEAVHDFIGAMPTPVTRVEMIKIGMQSHIPMEPKNSDPAVAGAIEYIERRGNEDANRLFEALNATRPAATRVRALTTKGNVFKFRDYDKCEKASAKLVWQFDIMEALAAFIGNPSWYWQNDEIIGHLKKLMVIDPNDIRQQFGINNSEIIAYVGETYSHIYGES
jgi:hypothetical protein